MLSQYKRKPSLPVFFFPSISWIAVVHCNANTTTNGLWLVRRLPSYSTQIILVIFGDRSKLNVLYDQLNLSLKQRGFLRLRSCNITEILSQKQASSHHNFCICQIITSSPHCVQLKTCQHNLVFFFDTKGVTSWGDAGGRGCARPMKPGVYSDVGAHVPWIFETMYSDYAGIQSPSWKTLFEQSLSRRQ